MINFKELIDSKWGCNKNFINECGLSQKEVESIRADYRNFLKLTIRKGRRAANSLGFHYLNLLYQVEEQILLDGLDDLISRWDDKLQSELEEDLLLEDMYHLIWPYCPSLRQYTWNKDICRSLLIAGKIYALQKRARPDRPYQTNEEFLYFARLVERNEELQKLVKEAKDHPDYFMKIACQISKGTDFKLHIKQFTKDVFFYINTIY